MVIRNSIYNLAGFGIPLVVALVAIPELIRHLGAEQFGILTIVWAVVGYFGLLDLGLGRAVTQQVALALAKDDRDRLARVVGTSIAMMLVLGIASGALMLALAPVLTHKLVHGSDPAVINRAFIWMAVAMPSIILSTGYRGVLEAAGEFGVINAIRLPSGLFTYAGPLAAVWLGWGRLDAISAVLCVGRVITCALHAFYARRALPGSIGWGQFDRGLIRELLSMGGWISVSNIVSPLMSYVDRFLLGLSVSTQAVAFYVTPQELVMRIGIIPTSIVAVLFPMFASDMVGRNPANARHQLWRYSLVILALLFPLCGVLATFAHPILALWISREFAEQAAAPLQVLAVAALFSGLAQIPFTMLQGRARADLTAKLHLVELPIYLLLLFALVKSYGVVGAAMAWLIRISADMIVLYVMCLRDLRGTKAGARETDSLPKQAEA